MLIILLTRWISAISSSHSHLEKMAEITSCSAVHNAGYTEILIGWILKYSYNNDWIISVQFEIHRIAACTEFKILIYWLIICK